MNILRKNTGEGVAVSQIDFAPAGNGRMVVALVILATLALSAWFTIEPGKYRSLTLILLGFFAFRVVLGRLRSR